MSLDSRTFWKLAKRPPRTVVDDEIRNSAEIRRLLSSQYAAVRCRPRGAPFVAPDDVVLPMHAELGVLDARSSVMTIYTNMYTGSEYATGIIPRREEGERARVSAKPARRRVSSASPMSAPRCRVTSALRNNTASLHFLESLLGNSQPPGVVSRSERSGDGASGLDLHFILLLGLHRSRLCTIPRLYTSPHKSHDAPRRLGREVLCVEQLLTDRSAPRSPARNEIKSERTSSGENDPVESTPTHSPSTPPTPTPNENAKTCVLLARSSSAGVGSRSICSPSSPATNATAAARSMPRHSTAASTSASMAALISAAFSAAPAPVPRGGPGAGGEDVEGSDEKGAVKAVVGAESVWRVSWISERGCSASRISGVRSDSNNVSCDFDGGPGRECVGQHGKQEQRTPERTDGAAEREDIDLERGAVDELVPYPQLGRTGHRGENRQVSYV